MDDIAPKLIENVNTDFDKNLTADKNAAALSEKLAAGQARYEDAYKYAETVGNARVKAFEDQISSEVLPEGKMHYNIASRLMTDSLTTDHEMISDYAVGVQKTYNEEAGINLKALKADVNEDRIKGFVERLSSVDNFDDVDWILKEPVITHARSVVDDTIKKNAEFQGRAGIKATVIRNADSKCCEWCAALEGDYVYPSVPREVFQRHDHCKCTVDYNGRKLTAYNSGVNSHTFRDQGEQEKIDIRKQEAIERELLFKKSIAVRRTNDIMKIRKEGFELLKIPQIPASTINAKVKSGEYSLRLTQQSYDKHIPGTQTYDIYLKARIDKGLNPQSVLTISKEETQEIIIQQSGTGIIKPRRDGSATDVEQITCNRIIGYYYQNGVQVSTNKAAIHHGRKGSHLVPIKGNHYD